MNMQIATVHVPADAEPLLADCHEAIAGAERGEPLSVSLRIRSLRRQGFAAKLPMAAVDRPFTAAF